MLVRKQTFPCGCSMADKGAETSEAIEPPVPEAGGQDAATTEGQQQADAANQKGAAVEEEEEEEREVEEAKTKKKKAKHESSSSDEPERKTKVSPAELKRRRQAIEAAERHKRKQQVKIRAGINKFGTLASSDDESGQSDEAEYVAEDDAWRAMQEMEERQKREGSHGKSKFVYIPGESDESVSGEKAHRSKTKKVSRKAVEETDSDEEPRKKKHVRRDPEIGTSKKEDIKRKAAKKARREEAQLKESEKAVSMRKSDVKKKRVESSSSSSSSEEPVPKKKKSSKQRVPSSSSSSDDEPPPKKKKEGKSKKPEPKPPKGQPAKRVASGAGDRVTFEPVRDSERREPPRERRSDDIGPDGLHFVRGDVDREGMAIVISTRDGAGSGLVPPNAPNLEGGIVYEPDDLVMYSSFPTSVPDLVRADICGSDPIEVVDTAEGHMIVLRTVVTSSAVSSSAAGIPRVVKDVSQLVFTYRAANTIRWDVRPDCYESVRLDVTALGRMELSSRTSMSMDSYSMTCFAGVLGSAMGYYALNESLIPPEANQSAQVVCMATNAQAIQAGLVLGPAFAQQYELVKLIARLAPLCGIYRIALLGGHMTEGDDDIHSTPYLAGLVLRLVSELIDQSSQYNLAGRIEFAFLRGLSNHVSLNAHNREGGFLRTLMRSSVYPRSSGYVSHLSANMYGNEGLVIDQLISVEMIRRIVLNAIVRSYYLAECAGPALDVNDESAQNDRMLMSAARLRQGGRPLLPFTAYRTSTGGNPLNSYGGLIGAVQGWAKRLQCLISGHPDSPETMTAATVIDTRVVNQDLRHLVDPMITPFYMIEPVLIRTHSCRPDYFCPGFDELYICTGIMAASIHAAPNMHVSQGMMFNVQFRATSLRAQGLCMLFSNRAECVSCHSPGGMRFWQVRREDRKNLLNVHCAKEGLRDLGDAIWRFPDSPFVHPLNGLVGATPFEVRFSNPGYGWFLENPARFGSTEVVIDVGQFNSASLLDRNVLSKRYSRYGRLVREVRELARYSFDEFDEHVVAYAPVGEREAPSQVGPVRISHVNTGVELSSLRTEQEIADTVGQRLSLDQGATLLQRCVDVVNVANVVQAVAGSGELRVIDVNEEATYVAPDDTGIVIDGVAVRCNCNETHPAIRRALEPGRGFAEPSVRSRALEAFSRNLGCQTPAEIFDILLTQAQPTAPQIVQALANGVVVTRSVNSYSMLLRGQAMYRRDDGYHIRYGLMSCGTEMFPYRTASGWVYFGVLTDQMSSTYDYTVDMPRRLMREFGDRARVQST